MLQVAAYCRVSTDKEDQANSFEAQQRYFREYIQRQPDWELQGIYADEGFSGTSTNKRVEFNKMLHAAELGQILPATRWTPCKSPASCVGAA